MQMACKGTRGGALMPDSSNKTPFKVMETRPLFFIRRMAQLD